MRFNYKMVKDIRINNLKMSQLSFIVKINQVSEGAFLITMPRYCKFESGSPKSTVNPSELAFIIKALGVEPNKLFYNEK